MLFARVDIGVTTEFPTKTAEKEEEKNLGLRFFFKSGRAHPVFNAGDFFHTFLVAKKLTFWEGGITSKLASQ